MRKAASLLVGSFVLGLLGTAAPALADPEYIFVNTEIYLSVVSLNTPRKSASVTRKPPTVKGRVKLENGACVLEVFDKSYVLQNCDLRNDSTLITYDHSGFFISDSDLIKIAYDIVHFGETHGNDPALTATAIDVLNGAECSITPSRMIEITNIYKWDGVDKDSRLSTMLTKGGRHAAYGVSIKFDFGGVYEYNRPTR